MGFIRDLVMYKYYDTPEGEDCFHKMFYVGKLSAAFGGLMGYYDCVAYRHLVPGRTKAGFFLRFMTVSVIPATACGVTFGAASCLLGSVDKLKNTHYPYVLGGALSGVVWGCFKGSVPMGCVAAAGFAFTAWWKKQSRLGNWRFFPDYETTQKYNKSGYTLYFRDVDWTVMALTNWKPRQTTYYFPASVDPLPTANVETPQQQQQQVQKR